jgi:predicted Ser/Thr protein kinase
MSRAEEILTGLSTKIREQERRAPVKLAQFMTYTTEHPELVLRNVFQRIYDMVISSVGKGTNEYLDDPESIHYVWYDCGSLFVEGTDHPFFADRLFANRLVNHFSFFRHGAQQNRIYIFEGPHGSGKSTFLNNLLMKFEQYSLKPEGAAYEIIWRLDRKSLNVAEEDDSHALLTQLMGLAEDSPFLTKKRQQKDASHAPAHKEFLEVPCPSHDHPFLIVPREYRGEMLNDLVKDEEFKKKLFSHKQYEWVFRDNPCTICLSLYQTLLDILGSPAKVFEMVYVRRYEFNRRLGQGISVFNPGDRGPKMSVLTNELLQSQLNGLLRDSNRVKYIFSRYASTNNGVYSLMDIKAHNKERFANLHGIISEGVHKVEDIEENVNSLFLALMNPEDRENIEGAQSFTDRITRIKMPYVLDYNTEVKIYKNTFGDQIEKRFLPRVLQNFAKIIISSRLKDVSQGCGEWIEEPERYSLFCDKSLHLLKMDIYAGSMPSWLNQEDRRNFTSKRRRAIIAESESEGDGGFSGRDSIKIFNEFYSVYGNNVVLISMPAVCAYFGERRKDLASLIPDGFLDSLLSSYNYAVLQEMKECLYYFNSERVSMDIQNYIYATNFEPGREERCHYTGETLDISETFFQTMEKQILGSGAGIDQMRAFRNEVQHQYASKTLTQEILLEGKALTATTVYNSLLERYAHSLKEKVMDPFLKNDNFRGAIKDFGTEVFKTYDKRVREEVTFLMKNLQRKYFYSSKGAKEICIYVIDSDLAGKFASS